MHHPPRAIHERGRIHGRVSDALLDVPDGPHETKLDRRVRLRLPLLDGLRHPAGLVIGIEPVEEPRDVGAPERHRRMDGEFPVGECLGRVPLCLRAVVRLLHEAVGVDLAATRDRALY